MENLLTRRMDAELRYNKMIRSCIVEQINFKISMFCYMKRLRALPHDTLNTTKFAPEYSEETCFLNMSWTTDHFLGGRNRTTYRKKQLCFQSVLYMIVSQIINIFKGRGRISNLILHFQSILNEAKSLPNIVLLIHTW